MTIFSLAYPTLTGLGATLTKAILNQAHLDNADFEEAQLNGAFLRGAYLQDTKLTKANLYNAKFKGANNLNLSQVRDANNWEEAKYDKKFCLDNQQYLENQQYNLQEDIDIIKDKKSEMYEAESSVNKMFCKLVSIMEKNTARTKEIAEIRKKITDIIQIIESGNSASLQENSLLEDLIKLLDQFENSFSEKQEVSPTELERQVKFSREKADLRNSATKLSSERIEAEAAIKKDEETFREAEEILRKDAENFQKAEEILRDTKNSN